MAGFLVISSLLVAGLIGPIVPTAVAVKPACKTQPHASDTIQEEPWNQAWFDASDKIWPFSTGAGTTVAVIDAGVDQFQAQLAGKVLPGYDFVRNVAEGDVDCVPHGTGEAGIIAATRFSGVGFYGLARDAKILPVRVTERAIIDTQGDPPVDPQKLADGIDFAVSHGANVIDCAVVSYLPDPRVAAAVVRAVRKGVIVIAMVGDSHSEDRDGIGPTKVPLPYPASYPGVIGVGAIDENGRRVSTSQIGSYVDLVAPGGNVVASAIGGQTTYSGTGPASAFVAASAALVLAEKPSLLGRVSGPALVREVTKRLLATGGPALSPQQRLAYGAGVVDPYRALTEASSEHGPVALPRHATPVPPPPNPAKVAAARARHHSNGLAVRLTAVIGGASVLLIVLALVLPRGRTRRWRPTRASTSRQRTDDPPEFVPGEALFTAPGRNE